MKNDWNKIEGRKAIFAAVMDYLRAHPDERVKCLDDNYARKLVTERGNTDIPVAARVVFFPEGDNLKGEGSTLLSGVHYNAGSSLVITLPPTGASAAEERFYACSYTLWGGILAKVGYAAPE